MKRTALALAFVTVATASGAHARTPPSAVRPTPPEGVPAGSRAVPFQGTPVATPEARPAPGPTPGPSAAVLEEVSGIVREVDRKAHRLAVDTGSERVTLSLDRNTMVYTPAGLGTVLDVRPGARIRAGRNAEFLAYWVQVRGPGADETPSAPGQGTGPGGGSGAPPSESGAASPGAVPGAAPSGGRSATSPTTGGAPGR